MSSQIQNVNVQQGIASMLVCTAACLLVHTEARALPLQMWPQQEALLPPGLMAKMRSNREQEISKSEEGLLKEAMLR